MSSLEPMASAPPYVMRSVFPDTLAFFDEMAYRALVPGDKIAADPATRRLVDRFQSTIWYDPDRHLMHYMIRGGEWLNAVAIVPWPRDRREVDRTGDGRRTGRRLPRLGRSDRGHAVEGRGRCLGLGHVPLPDLVWVDGFDERS
jgi:salicylate hydroxylase